MTFRILGFALLLFSFNSYSDNLTTYVKGEGRFYAQEEDSLSFVKRQLLYNAFRDILSKVLEKEGLNKDLFWRNYDEGFEKHFLPIQEELEKQFGITGEDVKASDKEKYQKALRMKRLKAKSIFGNLKSTIHSYSIKKMSRSSQLANSRYINIQAKVDKKRLGRLYIDFTREGENKTFENLYVTTDFSITNMSWADTGVELKKDFVEIIKKSWKENLEKTLGESVKAVVLTDEVLELRLKKFSQIPIDVTQNTGLLENSTNQGEFKDSAWLKINVEINKLKEDELLLKREFKISLSFILQDLNTNEILFFHDFKDGLYRYSFEEPHKLSSELASRIYNTPLPRFRLLKEKVQSIAMGQNEIFIHLKNLTSVQDAIHFNEFISGEGVNFQINPALERLENNEARIALKFLGTKQNFFNFLKGLNNANFGVNSFIVQEDEQKPYIFTVHKKEMPLETPESKEKNTIIQKEVKKETIIKADLEPTDE